MNASPSALILSEGQTASTDYYLFPPLEKAGFRVILQDSRQFSTQFTLPNHCALIVISRYISTHWLALLQSFKKTHALKIVYFMDDDLFDWQALKGLPWLYRGKILLKTLQHREKLVQLCDEFWFSTPYLVQKYAQLSPKLLNLTNLALPEKSFISVCYHGTASHRREIDWLLPIFAQVQTQTDNVQFELFGNRALNQRVKKIPRVYVWQPMNWLNYVTFSQSQTRTIGLAPLLDTRFNAARSACKFYDYARMGAVGIYSDVPPYSDFIRANEDGFLLPNEPDLWVEKILQLAQNVALREKIAANIQQRCVPF